MDYSSLSDFEVNCAVHNALMSDPYKLEFLGGDRIRWVKKGSDVVTGKIAYGKNTLRDYCNNPADAWPIISDNGICILWNWNEEGIHGATSLPIYEYEHENALRAAMVVFLMMREGKCE